MAHSKIKNKILTHNMLLQGIIVALVILFATLLANFWFTVAAYSYNTKSNSSGNLHSSNSEVGPYEQDNNNVVTLHNITNIVSFTGEVNVSRLPNLPSSKPGVIIDPEEQYLTRNYTSYINAKKQAELLRSANTPAAKVIEIRSPDLPLLVPNSSNNNSSAIIKTHFEGLSQVCCIPPDIQLAVSSKHAMETVNSEAAIYTKAGSLTKKFGLEFLFNLPSRESSDSHSITDPVLLFDSTSNGTRPNSHIEGNNDNRKWYASISDVTTHSIRIAISKTDDPMGVWRTYNFPFENSPNNCSDQPFIAVSDDKLLIGANTWSNNCDWSHDNNNNNSISSPKFRGIQLVIADKRDLLAEQQLAHIKSMQSVPNTKYFSLRPTLSLSPTTAIFLATTDDFNHNQVQILTIDGQISNLHINKAISGNIHNTSISPDGIQPITYTYNDNGETQNKQNGRQEAAFTIKEKHPEYFVHTGDARVQSPIWYKGKLWLALNVGCFINGDTRSRSCIRIIEFDTNTSKVLQDFNIGHIGASLYYPALSIDKSGNNIGIIFGYSSSDTYPSLLVASGLVKNNTIFNSLKYFQFLKNGTANSLSTRYGDYFSAVMDPSEPNSIWVAGQYYYNSSSSSALLWSTYIGKINTENSIN
jgi:hypothetical protein